MIASAAEYCFVDFQNGDLPTGRIDGHPMPLRPQTTQTPGVLTKDALVAEDVAFLAECVRDKVYAFENLRVTYPDGPYYPGPSTRDPVSLTKRIESYQMTNVIRKYIVDCMTSGKLPGAKHNVGFLRYSFAEMSNIDSADSDDDESIDGLPYASPTFAAIENAFYGTWAPSTTVADFAVDAPVLSAPVEALFDDAKNLVRPVKFVYGGQFLQPSSFYADVVEGSLSSSASVKNQLIYVSVNEPVSAEQYAYYGQVKANLSASEYIVARVSDEFLSDVNLWCVYLARNNLQGDFASVSVPRDPSATTLNRHLAQTGLINLENYLMKAHVPGSNGAPGEYVWYLNNAQKARNLILKIASDCNFGLVSSQGSYIGRQFFYPFDDSALLFVGTPNGRTKWW